MRTVIVFVVALLVSPAAAQSPAPEAGPSWTEALGQAHAAISRQEARVAATPEYKELLALRTHLVTLEALAKAAEAGHEPAH